MRLPIDLVNKISSIKPKHKSFIIGIDGFGGSGKTSLAKLLKKHFEKATIVEMDDFYLPSLKRADYQRVKEQVLMPLTNDMPASYQRYDWKTDRMAEWHTIKPGAIVIIEGVYSTNNNIKSMYDFKIWIECPQDVGMERGAARDLTKDKVENRNKWINDWMPLEKKYVNTHNPKQYADYIVDGSKD